MGEVSAAGGTEDASSRLGASEPATGGHGPARVIAVTSGKGGVGKTNVVANLAYGFTQLGSRVLVLDADLGLANLDVLLGLVPQYTLRHVLGGEKHVSEVVLKGPGGMQILPASSGAEELAALDDSQRLSLLAQVEELEKNTDILLIDTAAGISSNVIYFNVAAQEILVIASPEPTSITDAYALMKVLFLNHGEKKFRLLVNFVQKEREALHVFEKLSVALDRFLNVSLDYVGCIPLDENMPRAVRRQRLVSECYPNSPASRSFARLTQEIAVEAGVPFPKGNVQFFWRTLLEQRPRD